MMALWAEEKSVVRQVTKALFSVEENREQRKTVMDAMFWVISDA